MLSCKPRAATVSSTTLHASLGWLHDNHHIVRVSKNSGLAIQPEQLPIYGRHGVGQHQGDEDWRRGATLVHPIAGQKGGNPTRFPKYMLGGFAQPSPCNAREHRHVGLHAFLHLLKT